MSVLANLLQEEEGASALEYGLLVGFIALVMAAGAVILGEGLNSMFGDAGTEIKSTGDPNPLPSPNPRY